MSIVIVIFYRDLKNNDVLAQLQTITLSYNILAF